MKYVYIVNRFSLRGQTDEVMAKLRAASEALHRDYVIALSETVEDAVSVMRRYHKTGTSSLSAEDDESILTAIGGDGSIHHLVNAFADTGHILSFVPYGTGNDFYRTCLEEFGAEELPGKDTGGKEPSANVHEIDLIRVNDRYCVNTLCFGIDADIANDESFIHNRFIPRSMRFNAGVVYHFLTYGKGRRLTVEYGQKKISRRFTTVVVANGRYYGCGYRVSPGSMLDDGRMEVYLMDRVRKIKMARLILSMKHAGHLKDPALHLRRTNRLVVTADRPVRANIDGEPLFACRFEMELVPRAIRLEFDREFIRLFRQAPHR